MEQVKVDYTKDKVAYVRAASQLKFSKEPMTIGFLVNNKFNVRYVISDNRIQGIIYDMAEMPNKDTLGIMQRYLSIDNIDHVTVVVPKDKVVQIWRWNDLSKAVLDNEKEKEQISNDIIKPKEVSKNGKSEKNNVQNKPRRDKTIEHCCDKKDCINYNSYAEPCEKCSANYANRKPVIAEDSEFDSSTCKSVFKEQ